MKKKLTFYDKEECVIRILHKNESGDILFETNEILNRWTEYVEKLFDDKRDETYLQHFLQGPIILKSEVENALNSMSKGKSSGIDDITTEMLQALGEFGIDTLTSICYEMYTNVYEDLEIQILTLNRHTDPVGVIGCRPYPHLYLC